RAAPRAARGGPPPPHVLPGLNLLRHHLAAGNLRFERYRWVRENLDPVRHFDHTFLLFDVSPANFDRFLEAQRRLAPSPLARRLCGEGAVSLAPGPPFTVADEVEPTSEVHVLCVDAPRGADFVLRVLSGHLVFGPADRPGSGHDYAEPGQELWFRLDPGLHAFTVRGQQDFRGAW